MEAALSAGLPPSELHAIGSVRADCGNYVNGFVFNAEIRMGATRGVTLDPWLVRAPTTWTWRSRATGDFHGCKCTTGGLFSNRKHYYSGRPEDAHPGTQRDGIEPGSIVYKTPSKYHCSCFDHLSESRGRGNVSPIEWSAPGPIARHEDFADYIWTWECFDQPMDGPQTSLRILSQI
jgi:hypothetical protein